MLVPEDELIFRPVHHGWLTIDGIHAIDVTLRDTRHCQYFGVAFSIEQLTEHFLSLGSEGMRHTSVLEEMLGVEICDPHAREHNGADIRKHRK